MREWQLRRKFISDLLLPVLTIATAKRTRPSCSKRHGSEQPDTRRPSQEGNYQRRTLATWTVVRLIEWNIHVYAPD
jgi:hypothetical protein